MGVSARGVDVERDRENGGSDRALGICQQVDPGGLAGAGPAGPSPRDSCTPIASPVAACTAQRSEKWQTVPSPASLLHWAGSHHAGWRIAAGMAIGVSRSHDVDVLEHQ